MYYVYVLHSEADHGLYIGFTTDLARRVLQHNEGESKSTSSRRPFRLIYYEAYATDEDALGREKFLKSGAGRRLLDKQLKHYFVRYKRRTTV
jgi:putative endonuclease